MAGELSVEPADRFRAIYERQVDAILGFTLRRMASTTEAADVTAETLLVAWRRLNDIPLDAGERLWLYRVASNVMANAHRSEVRRHRLAERFAEELATSVATLEARPEPAVLVALALDRLTAGDRELLRLSAWEELSPSEIALVLDLPTATVRTRLHRARERVRGHLDDASDNTTKEPR